MFAEDVTKDQKTIKAPYLDDSDVAMDPRTHRSSWKRKTTSTGGLSTSLGDTRAPRFTLFPTLPKELRLMIWEAAASQCRIVEMHCNHFGTQFSCHTPMPPIAHTCAESRGVAMKKYDRLTSETQFEGAFINWEQDILFFNFQSQLILRCLLPDIYMSADQLKKFGEIKPSLQHLTRKCHRIAINARSFLNIHPEQLIDFNNIKELFVIQNKLPYAEKESRTLSFKDFRDGNWSKEDYPSLEQVKRVRAVEDRRPERLVVDITR
ncbi:hypothetical protein B7494_g5781 [Chlorociboria aeruginascens]|nr:hypothetical protein B7494_g5781 [Chlorociboria aeruginascens]